MSKLDTRNSGISRPLFEDGRFGCACVDFPYSVSEQQEKPAAPSCYEIASTKKYKEVTGAENTSFHELS